MKIKFCLLALLFLIIQSTFAQDYSKAALPDTGKTAKNKINPIRRWGDGGVGIGLDYGGIIGVKASFYPISNLGVFAAVGWEAIDFGWNAGCLARLFPADGRHGWRPYLKVMYGVNAVTEVTGLNGYNHLYYGFTPGIGLEIRFGRFKKSGLNLDLNFPFRSPQYFSMINSMKSNPEITMKSTPTPVAFSLGYLVEF